MLAVALLPGMEEMDVVLKYGRDVLSSSSLTLSFVSIQELRPGR